jgi:aminoglycoside phosphotransferase family enzyme
MKRAVKLPYVDFSTPALRLAACEKEVELNSRTAPGLYLGVRRITRKPTANWL